MTVVQVFPSSKAIESLQLELELLQILHHRNKNQHHLQPFFKHLSILKRTLAHLLQNPESGFLLQKLRDGTLLYAWEEFSRVVARGEFVALGMVLCGSVARIAYCLGGIEGIGDLESTVQESGPVPMEEEIGEIFSREEVMEEYVEIDEIAERVTPSQLTTADETDEAAPTEIQTTTITETATVTMDERDAGIGEILLPTKKRRKRKGEDEIDLLFNGL
jgi:hypothetical protein